MEESEQAHTEIQNESVASIDSKDSERKAKQLVSQATLVQLLSRPQFRCIYTMNILSVFNGVFFVSSAKTYGGEFITDESFLSHVGAIASIFAALRFFWSFFLDKYSYKTIYSILICF